MYIPWHQQCALVAPVSPLPQNYVFEPPLSRVFAMCEKINLFSPELSQCFSVLEEYSRHSILAEVHVGVGMCVCVCVKCVWGWGDNRVSVKVM